MKFKDFFTKRKIIFSSVTVILIAALGISVWAVSDNFRERDSDPIFDEAQIADNDVTSGEKVVERITDGITENSKNTESVNVSEIQKTEINSNLSADDISLKKSISAVSDTKVDFRVNKQVELLGNTYQPTFSKLGDYDSNTQGSIIYKDNANNEFRFELATGRMVAFYLPSETIFEKSDSSITAYQAEKIAKDYYGNNYNGYTFSECKEESGGYTFYYNRYYLGYKTDDSVIIRVGFNGKINRLITSTNSYDNINIKISENKVAAEKQKIIEKYKNAEIQECRLKNYKNKVYMEIQYKYTTENGYSTAAVGMVDTDSLKD